MKSQRMRYTRWRTCNFVIARSRGDYVKVSRDAQAPRSLSGGRRISSKRRSHSQVNARSIRKTVTLTSERPYLSLEVLHPSYLSPFSSLSSISRLTMGHVALISCKEGVTLLLLRPVSNHWSRWPILELIPITHDKLGVHELRVAGLTLVHVGVDPVLARATVPVALVLAHLAAMVLIVVFLHA